MGIKAFAHHHSPDCGGAGSPALWMSDTLQGKGWGEDKWLLIILLLFE